MVRLSGLGENLELASGTPGSTTSSRDRTRPSSLVSRAVKQRNEAEEVHSMRIRLARGQVSLRGTQTHQWGFRLGV